MTITAAMQANMERSCAALNEAASSLKTMQDNVTANVSAVATNTSDIATNTAAIAALGAPTVTVTDYSADDTNKALVGAEVVGGLIRRGGLTATRTDTLPDADDLVASLSSPTVGQMVEVSFQQETVAAQDLVVTSGAGGTDVATAIMRTLGSGTAGRFGLLLTNVTLGTEAYSLYRLA